MFCRVSEFAERRKLADPASAELEGGIAQLNATLTSTGVVPNGFEQLYLLSHAATGVLLGVAPSPSNFAVATADSFDVHALVVQTLDPQAPDFFDLGQLQVGQTSIATLRSLLPACADLGDVFARFYVGLDEPPGSMECLAEVPSLTRLGPQELNLELGTALLAGELDEEASQPAGYTTTYLLVQGPALQVIDYSVDPSFVVLDTGSYRIVPLVAQVDDPSADHYVDLEELVVAQASILNVLRAWALAGTCLDLDVIGLDFIVYPEGSCLARTGRVQVFNDTLTLNEQGEVSISFQTSGGYLPEGFERLFLVVHEGTGRVVLAGSRPRGQVRRRRGLRTARCPDDATRPRVLPLQGHA